MVKYFLNFFGNIGLREPGLLLRIVGKGNDRGKRVTGWIAVIRIDSKAVDRLNSILQKQMALSP